MGGCFTYYWMDNKRDLALKGGKETQQK